MPSLGVGERVPVQLINNLGMIHIAPSQMDHRQYEQATEFDRSFRKKHHVPNLEGMRPSLRSTSFVLPNYNSKSRSFRDSRRSEVNRR